MTSTSIAMDVVKTYHIDTSTILSDIENEIVIAEITKLIESGQDIAELTTVQLPSRIIKLSIKTHHVEIDDLEAKVIED